MQSFFVKGKTRALIAVFAMMMLSACAQASHPNLVLTHQDITQMREAILQPGRFKSAFDTEKSNVDQLISSAIAVPVPQDGGGGYTHEQHKKNYQLMYRASIIYQLTQERHYAEYVRDMLLEYAKLYPTLDVHPKRKVKAQNPGKLFWQSLNEAMWLVYTIQAYDLIYDALDQHQISTIENNLLKPVALFLSDGQPSTFNKVHNHGTWATAGVGMAGYVMNEPEWVEKALYDLEKSGNGGFLKQLDILFSPQGYYNEGPYYHRFALLPFVTFARAIENNEPGRAIFKHRDSVLIKAIYAAIDLSYNGLFFPINDAIKSKGIDTIELVHAVAAAYALTNDNTLLEIASKQNQILLTGDGLKVAGALDKGLEKSYQYHSKAFGDGSDGTEGALVVMRSNLEGEPALLFKPASQGLGHGHFDKLTWQFYDHGKEIVSDYGAARFLNVEAKYGGRYLPENETYAKQTIAHNTLVVDETSHFNANEETGNANAPTLSFFETNEFGTVASGHIDTAYSGVNMTRTLALVNLPALSRSIAIDIFNATANSTHQFDLPLHYQGQLIETNFAIEGNTQTLTSVGKRNGYQHLWQRGQAKPEKGLAKVTWLNENGRFYTQSSITNGDEAFLFTQIGASDPNFNLRNEHGFIRRVEGVSQHSFVSILEPHGEYNPGKEYTLNAVSQVSALQYTDQDGLSLIELTIENQQYLIAIDHREIAQSEQSTLFTYNDATYTLNGRLGIYSRSNHQE